MARRVEVLTVSDEDYVRLRQVPSELMMRLEAEISPSDPAQADQVSQIMTAEELQRAGFVTPTYVPEGYEPQTGYTYSSAKELCAAQAGQ